ncbi:MAG TPA: M23 family metallopeptidase [Terracidiphilus sp.]|nr:M23 family metallopeptidase [Terracidiphilus sp.]
MPLILAQATGEQAGVPILSGLAGLAVILGSIAVLVRGLRESRRFHAAWLKRFHAQPAVSLEAPFQGRWRALETGPSIARNHHLAARDQWFAVDWVRIDAPSRGSAILSPGNGVIAHVEDGHADKPSRRWLQADKANPAGNYVSLRLDGQDGQQDVFVILAHLAQGSIVVRSGEAVQAGELLGLCGNSGNTTIPHLHIHVQPVERFAAGSIWGIPIVFGERTGWIQPREIATA